MISETMDARDRTHQTTTFGKAPVRLNRPGSAYAVGSFHFIDQQLADIAARDGASAAWLAAFERYGAAAPTKAQGDFAVAVCDQAGRVFLAVDRFAIRTLCYHVGDNAIDVHERADILADLDEAWDPQAIFDYLYFHIIPAPRTIFKGIARLPAAHYALLEHGRLTVAAWWNPVFVEDNAEPFEKLRDEFRGLLHAATARQLTGGEVGCFLSGGTDSSTIAGMLTKVTGKRARTFSIGFDAQGYDEMEYARIAAKHFDTEHHEYYVTPDDLVASIPAVAASCDQPFGNSSVVPSYFCAKLARESGMDKVLGGDGGDELFGGNSRYIRQRTFDAYTSIPHATRSAVLEPLLLGKGAVRSWPGIRKLASYVDQARIPMPDRMQTYNLLARLGMNEVLTPEFLSTIDILAPLRQQRVVYATSTSARFINRMLAFDWRYTLAENDLPKVIGATSLASLQVGFPMLDDALVDFSLRLQPGMKVKGFKLRWFFKEALRGFLPDEILKKKKHGFGLPFGVWVNRPGALHALASESLAALGKRGVVRADFIERLFTQYLPQHPGYYGEMVWVLMMLEQWMRRCRIAL